MILQKKIPFNKTTYGSQKEYIGNKSQENPCSMKMSFGQILYYDGYGSYDFAEKFRLIKPRKLRGLISKNSILDRKKKKNKENASSENLTTKKMNTGPSLYYDEFGSYDFPKMKSCQM